MEDTKVGDVITVAIERTRLGKPCMWECGGMRSNIGKAIIFADANGDAMRPYFTRYNMLATNGQHALMPLFRGAHMVNVEVHRGRDPQIYCWVVDNITNRDTEHPVAFFRRIERKGILECAIRAAIKKASTHNCREATYIKKGAA